MKQFTTILSILLVIAVGVLFYMNFKHKSEIKDLVSELRVNDTVSSRPLKIAYVDLDSIEAHYDYFKQKREELEKKREALDYNLNSTFQRIETDRMNFIKRGSAVTPQEQQQFQQEYAQRMTTLENQKVKAQQEIEKVTMMTMDEMKNKINAFISEYNKTRGYTYIIATSSNSNMLFYKDTTFNITSDVLKGLNAAYKKQDQKK